jgi:Fic family protein
MDWGTDDIGSGLRLADANREAILAHGPPGAEEAARAAFELKVELTYTSNALEGNSLTRDETRAVLEGAPLPGGRPIRHVREAVGHSDASDLMTGLVREGGTDLLIGKIRRMHHLFYRDISYTEAGNYRLNPVMFRGITYIPPKPLLLAPLMGAFERDFRAFEGSAHRLELAAFAHMRLVDIHPFVDGNGRTARLLMNLVLMGGGYRAVCIPPGKRDRYLDAVRASQNAGDPSDTPFLRLLVSEELDAQSEHMRQLGIA